MNMRIAIHDADGGKFPNLALLKLSAFHKTNGDYVERFMPLHTYDCVYSSKVFSWTYENRYLPINTIKGGTGYNVNINLDENIEHICPDYDFYKLKYSIGFLTRGCIRACPWCVVPKKEGKIRKHADIEEFTRHKYVILMDNNVLAHEHGIQQIEKIRNLELHVDFNQGLDARLFDFSIAKLLTSIRWISCLRLACDHKNQMSEVEKAVNLLRAAGFRREISCYVLVQEIDDALYRVEFLRSLGVRPFAQPFRPIGDCREPKKELKNFARWVNHRAIFKTVAWNNYKEKYNRKKQNKNFDELLLF